MLKMKEKILITSALPYANAPLHFGHIAGAYLPGDCYARFERLKKNDVLYICGSDEYGVAITLSADLANRTPKEHVDIFHEINKNLFKKLNFSFDHFSRTTTSYHQKPVQVFFLNLLKNGYIEEKTTKQLFSEKDNRFLADRYVVGTCPKCGYENARGDECQRCGSSYESTDLINPKSKLTGQSLTLKDTKHWFLLLDKFRDRLLAWLETKSWKPNVVNFIKGYIQDLKPRAITRDLSWGIPIPLPNTEGKVLYVWFDAPIGYISATMEWAALNGEPEAWKDFWFDQKTKLVHFLGKDNIPFHAAIFPAMVMGQDAPYVLVSELPANEFYNLEGKKFSKSEGWAIDLDDFFTKYTADQIRYVIASNAPETQDSEFTWKDFQLKCNSDLLGKWGNLVNRVLVFAKQNCDRKVPKSPILEDEDKAFLKEIKELSDKIEEAYANFKLRRASQLIMELAQKGNVYFDQKKPWLALKNPELIPKMRATIYCSLQAIKFLALTSYPIIPEASQKVWKLIGFTTDLKEADWDIEVKTELPFEKELREPEILFKKVEEEEVAKELENLKKLHEKAKKNFKNENLGIMPFKDKISFDDFQKLDLRSALILKAEKIPKSKKLLKLTVNLGLEERTIVSGIAESYTPEEIIGKSVVVVANLEPTTIMGVVSEGMLLAGSLESGIEILTSQKIQPGTLIK
ncbi:Methionyl-tRNA synthetase [Criblamydia sequanensis CRIB-18]|uniref:Methionine--tRNA ligase n=2 Tax=Candidatus Criblamydia sequanensis TaxID=340071 RepID=A0A090E339_9BACT|nr:Methionyl-tRNA synthetase [Criblamydia sequanensis CRIB-18]